MKKVVIATLVALSFASAAQAGFKSAGTVECVSRPDGRGGYITTCR